MTTRILNDKLLSYIEQYSTSFPNRWAKLYSALDAKRHGSGAALPPCITDLAPVFFARAISLVGGNPSLCKRTILYRTSNACPVCSQPMVKPDGGACSVKCRGLNPKVKEKARATSYAKYGTENPMQNANVKATLRQTLLAKYGVDNPQKHQAVKAKTAKTNTVRYGGPNISSSPEVRAKAKATMVTRYGVENPGQSQELRDKRETTSIKKWGAHCNLASPAVRETIKKTSLVKFGVQNAMQNTDIIEKCRRSGTKRKTYVELNGRIHDTIQGYEPQVLEWLNVVKGVHNFVTRPSLMPAVVTNKGVYIPDARFKTAKGKMYLLEVKSDHTLLDDWTNNLDKFRKANAWCLENGFVFLLALSNGKFGDKPIFVSNPNAAKIKSALAKLWLATQS